MLSRELEATLNDAFRDATARRHEFMTVEHLLLALLDNQSALRVLKPGGAFVVKVFQGEGYEAYRRQVQEHFKVLKSRKPQASRPRSPEVYLVGEGFKG